MLDAVDAAEAHELFKLCLGSSSQNGLIELFKCNV